MSNNPSNLISSPQNPRIKRLREFRKTQKMKTAGCFCVEGMREITLAQQNYAMLELYTHADNLHTTQMIEVAKDVARFRVTPAVFAKIAVRENKDGVIAVFASKYTQLSELELSSNPLLVVCQEMQKPGNLGAIIRTSTAVGCDALIVVEQRMNIFNPNVIRASLGYVFTSSIAVANSAEVLAFLQRKNIGIVLADGVERGTTYTDYDFTAPTAVVFGSEAEGLSTFWRQTKIPRLHIPMHPPVSSLNVSVAGGIVLYEARRQRGTAVLP